MIAASFLAVVALSAVVPGSWTGSTSEGPKGSRARVTFDVAPDAGIVSPFARVDLRGCRSTRTVHLRRSFGVVAARAGRFAVRARYSPPGRAQKVRLRLVGRFVSDTRARGFVRGRIRYAGGRICRIPRLSWTARPVGLARGTDPGTDDDFDDGDEFDDDEDFDDDEFDDDDGDDGEDLPDDEDPGEDDDEGEDEGDDEP
jgi:hypothetical protein